MGSAPSMLTTGQVERLLVQAIHDKRVIDAGRDVLSLDRQRVTPEGRRLAQSAIDTCAAIRRYNASEQQRMITRLAEAGVPASAGDDPRTSVATQIHRFELNVEAKALATALAVARDDGYRGAPWRNGALRSVLWTRSDVTLVKTDEAATRLNVRWRARGARRRGSRFFRPSDADYRLIDLPAALWFLYSVVKPVRLLTARVLGRRALASTLFLGTPVGLIGALLDTAAVTADDVVMDLGCGDGRILVEAARRRACRAVGVEQDAALVRLAREKIETEALGDLVSVRHGDFRAVDLTDVSVLFLFLPVDAVARLIPSLRQRLPSGARIVAHEQTPIDPQLKPERSVPLFAPSALTVAHVWRVA